ncbi:MULTISPECIES: hypothetical protein [Methanobacterium]|uniref:Uncharacterized protein n=1 Tax=Methanobacterium bryantii TaxID=2161 RepID=A0A2A2H8E4_METBR|nr:MULTISPECIES: hypothetical protein [Methanobacterium]OEC84389.1 hypothetical protein A9507_02290 [Methanobacterium sp. A39]PAV05615.1 hypothetical protein ASJ80_08890 [Methanobacterium bryantii]
MLPDFPSVKTKIENATTLVVSEKTYGSPLLSKVNKKRCFEGSGISFIDNCGDYVEREIEETSTNFSLKLEEILDKGLSVYLEKSLNAVSELQQKMTKKVLEEVDIATAKAGTQINTSKKLITEIYLDGLEKIQIDFDEKGNPFLPSLAMHPNDVLKHDKRLQKYLKENPRHMGEYEKKLEEIIENKRKDWNDRESNRKLVD